MNDKVTGIILKHTDYKDNAVILTVITKEFGKISLIAQGVKKMNSKLAGSVFPYTVGEFLFDYKDEKSMFRLKNARTISMYRYLHEDLNASCAASLIAEAADRFLLEFDILSSNMMFDLVKDAYDLINTKRNTVLVSALFIARVLDMQGIAPVIDSCVHCGKTNAISISVKEGGFICPECAIKMNYEPKPIELLKSFRYVNKADFTQFDGLEKNVSEEIKVLEMLIEFLKIHAGVELRSYGLYKRLLVVE